MTKRKNPETSIEAYKKLDPLQLAEIYREILATLVKIGEGTFEDIAAAMKVDKSKVWKRLSELHQNGMIYRPGKKKALKSGRDGFVWMLTDGTLPKTQKAEKMLEGKTVSDFSREIKNLSTPIQTAMFNDAI